MPHSSAYDLRVPIQTCFGRRPVLIMSCLICFGSSIWRAKANSYNSFMGACALNGIGAGPSETAQPTIIADVIFLHDRGKFQTLYFAFYFGSLMVSGLTNIASFQIADIRRLDQLLRVPWRNTWDGEASGGSTLHSLVSLPSSASSFSPRQNIFATLPQSTAQYQHPLP